MRRPFPPASGTVLSTCVAEAPAAEAPAAGVPVPPCDNHDEMTAPRRIGTEGSASRAALLDAALALMVEEGYAAVTSRRVAARAGLKPQLVHYYFRTMDDLFLALVRRGAELNLERQETALASTQPLRALWELSTDPAGIVLTVELFALANHRKAVRAELVAYAERFRQRQAEALDGILERYRIDADELPPAAAPVVMTGLSRIIGLEKALGLTTGHDELRALVERWLGRYEGEPAEPTARPAARSLMPRRRSGASSPGRPVP
jgi:AcrR family transcriptional regulator